MGENPNKGKLVTCLENDLGIGKIVESNPDVASIEYFDSAVSLDHPVSEVRMTTVQKVTLDKHTRAYFLNRELGVWKMGQVEGHVDDQVFINLPHGKKVRLPEKEVYVRWRKPVEDPWGQLASRLTESPFYHRIRSSLVLHILRQRSASMGMTALLSAPVQLEHHQVEVVRRVLSDPIQRYLLADEVGLGKTIEAGIIIRQHVLDNPNTHRILVVVPRGLELQWEEELLFRCRLGNPFGHDIEIRTHQNLTEWEGKWPDFVVVDEAHQITRESLKPTFEKLRQIAAPDRCPGLLLLSATPVLRNEEGFLALLHLLDPVVYKLEDLASFRTRVEKRQDLADLFAGLTEEQDPFFLEGCLEQLSELFPSDPRLQDMLCILRAALDSENEKDRKEQIRRVRLHLSETYRLHRRILRNRRTESLETLLTGRHKLLSLPFEEAGKARIEEALEAWRSAAAAALWGKEESTEVAPFSDLFVTLLEAAWCDPLALLYCVKVRMARELLPAPSEFGLLTESDRLEALIAPPHFEDEESHLRAMLDLERVMVESRNQHIAMLKGVAIGVRKKGFKVVCISTTPQFADDLFDQIRKEHPDIVARHSPTDFEWLDRWEYKENCILVCDSRAEEGFNLQGGQACMLHADLPLSPNRMEQRLGRLDRFGVGKKVTSLTFEHKDCAYWKAWSRCLDEAWNVFQESIATLQYVVDEEMQKLRQPLLMNGATALDEAFTRLTGDQGIERERRFIRNQDALDAIKYASEDEAASLLARIETYEKGSAEFQEAVNGWLLAGLNFVQVGETKPDDPVVRYHFRSAERSKPTLVSRFDLQHWFGQSLDFGARHPEFESPLTHSLAFRRETALNRKVGIARVGNVVIDAIRAHLASDDRGTSFALWRQTQDVETGEASVFFRLDFIVEADVSKLEVPDSEKTRRRIADAAFPPIIRTLWLDKDHMPPSPRLRQILEMPYSTPEDTNIRSDYWKQALKAAGCDDWPGWCNPVRDAATARLRDELDLKNACDSAAKRYEKVRSQAVEQAESRLEALKEDPRGQESLREELSEFKKATTLLAAGIRNPMIRLDACGAIFLSTKKFEFCESP